MNDLIDQKYLPYSAEELKAYFINSQEKHVEYYTKSAHRYHQYLTGRPDRNGDPVKASSGACQIERDEKFWTAATMIELAKPVNKATLESLLSKAFGPNPPIPIGSWKECLNGRLQLRLEAPFSSPAT